jgi:hypothetical protein
MVRRRVEVKEINYGLYEAWDRAGKMLPGFLKFTDQIPARPGVEFGYILEIRGAKRAELTFEIIHPSGIHDPEGNRMPDVFRGREIIPQNEYRFFLGDTVWVPIAEKCGPWRLKTFIDGEPVADRTLNLFYPEDS